jgi:hypothetical protein
MTEAQLFKSFIEYLTTKTDHQVFNVPYGKIETIPYQRMKLFLLLSYDQNCPLLGKPEVSTFNEGEVTFDPFFVIDPFDKSKNPMKRRRNFKYDRIRKYLNYLCVKI